MAFLTLSLAFDAGWVRREKIPPELKPGGVILFPELLDGGYAALHRRDPASEGELLKKLQELSRIRDLSVIAGSLRLRDRQGRQKNATLVFSRGKLVHRYDKIHLFPPGGDRRWFSPGGHLGTFPLPIRRGSLRAGVVICFDLRFPELVRALALHGVRILFVPARWPLERNEAWRTLLRARAIENQIFVAGCNALGREGGASYVFDPLGKEVYASRRAVGESVHTLRLDLGRLSEARRPYENLHEAVLLKAMKIPSVLPERP
jgi:omega-amidase